MEEQTAWDALELEVKKAHSLCDRTYEDSLHSALVRTVQFWMLQQIHQAGVQMRGGHGESSRVATCTPSDGPENLWLRRSLHAEKPLQPSVDPRWLPYGPSAPSRSASSVARALAAWDVARQLRQRSLVAEQLVDLLMAGSDLDAVLAVADYADLHRMLRLKLESSPSSQSEQDRLVSALSEIAPESLPPPVEWATAERLQTALASAWRQKGLVQWLDSWTGTALHVEAHAEETLVLRLCEESPSRTPILGRMDGFERECLGGSRWHLGVEVPEAFRALVDAESVALLGQAWSFLVQLRVGARAAMRRMRADAGQRRIRLEAHAMYTLLSAIRASLMPFLIEERRKLLREPWPESSNGWLGRLRHFVEAVDRVCLLHPAERPVRELVLQLSSKDLPYPVFAGDLSLLSKVLRESVRLFYLPHHIAVLLSIDPLFIP